MTRKKKLIVVTASNGGVGKSTYAKLVANTAIDLKYPLVLGDMDALHPDVATGFTQLDADISVITEMTSYSREAMITRPDEPADELIERVVGKIVAQPEEGVAIINTPSSALTTIERYRDMFLPKNGEGDDIPGVEIYLAYLLTPDDTGDIYQDGSAFLELGPEHLITVVTHFNALTPEQRDDMGATSDKTKIVDMKSLPGRIHRQLIRDAATANFRDPKQMANHMGAMVSRWWFTQAPAIAATFGLSAPTKGANQQSPAQLIAKEEDEHDIG